MKLDDFENKKKFIDSVMSVNIDIEKAKSTYISEFSKIDICSDLEIALNRKDFDAVDLFLYFGSVVKYEYKCISILNELILSKWHYKHEDLALILQHYQQASSVNPLYQASSLNLDYLDFDDSYALAVKCIWALGDIGTQEALEKLEILSNSDNDIIKANAIKQLNRHKK